MNDLQMAPDPIRCSRIARIKRGSVRHIKQNRVIVVRVEILKLKKIIRANRVDLPGNSRAILIAERRERERQVIETPIIISVPNQSLWSVV